MTRPTAKFLIAIFSFLLVAVADTAYGCTCRRTSPCAAFESANAVFVGKMIRGTEKNIEKDQAGNSIIYEAGYTRFEVEEAFKGVTGKEVTIFLNSMKQTSCEWAGYLPGERYLIFARELDGKLTIGPCSQSKRIQPSWPDEPKAPNFNPKYWYWGVETGLKFFRSLSASGTGGRFCVIAKMMDEKTSIRDATIVIQGQDNSRYEVVTNEYGEATIENVSPGKYAIKTTWPKGITGWHQPEIEITERGCSELKASAIYSGLISGRVLDGKGQPAQSVNVYLSSVDDQEKGNDSVTTKENGSFEIGNILPGKYYLYFQTNQEDKTPYFYPGVFNKAKATTITIGLGEKSEELEFKLPSTFEMQTIKGKVVMPDGKPVTKATIYLKCPIEVETNNLKIKIPEADAVTDSEGNFTITGFKGVSYSIKAVLSTSGPNSWSYKEHIHSPLVRLFLAEEPIELRLILSESTYGPDCDTDKRQRGQN